MAQGTPTAVVRRPCYSFPQGQRWMLRGRWQPFVTPVTDFIRRINIATGVVVTLTGSVGFQGGSANGVGTSGRLLDPVAVSLDSARSICCSSHAFISMITHGSHLTALCDFLCRLSLMAVVYVISHSSRRPLPFHRLAQQRRPRLEVRQLTQLCFKFRVSTEHSPR